MKKNSYSDLARNNKLVTICHTIVALVISFAYFAEYLKNARTLGYVLFTCLLCLISPAFEWFFFKKNPETTMVKHFAGYGFAIFYIFIMFTTENTLAFIYAIPMLVATSVYCDFSFSMKVNIGGVLVNIGQAVMFFSKGIYTKQNMSGLEIQILSFILIATYSMYVAKTTSKNNNIKIERINEQARNTENILSDVMSVSLGITDNITLINDKITILDEALNSTRSAMEQVNKGAEETANAVELQLNMTNNISERITQVNKGANDIKHGIDNTLNAVSVGNKNVCELISQAGSTKDIGNEVERKLNELNQIMNNMNSVVEIITDITSQTSLLALNASIEAARAGDAGKGFAVVASEITKMANDTQGATVKITDMISDVRAAIQDVVEVTEKIVTEIDNQSRTTSVTADSFEKIENNTKSIVDSAESLIDAISQLSKANSEIIESVSTISAITEEVSAHANNTYNTSEENSATVKEVVEIADVLEELTNKLKINN